MTEYRDIDAETATVELDQIESLPVFTLTDGSSLKAWISCEYPVRVER